MPPIDADSPAPSISYIIPTLDEERSLPRTLQCLHEQVGQGEVIVVDGGSRDATLKIAQANRCRIVHSPPGRGAQLSAGAAQALHPFLCFVHADTLLPRHASREIIRLLNQPEVVAGSFRLQFDQDGKPLNAYALCSRINHSLFTYGDQGLFLRQSTYLAIGGHKPYPFLEDVEIQRRLRALGRFAKSSLPATTSARRFARRGPFVQQTINILIVAAYLLGASPEFLQRHYPHVR